MQLSIYQDRIDREANYVPNQQNTGIQQLGLSILEQSVKTDTNNLMMEYNTAKLDLDLVAKDRENRADLDGNFEGKSVVKTNLKDYKALSKKYSSKAIWGETRRAVSKFSLNVDNGVKRSNANYTTRLANIKSSVNLSNMVTKTIENINPVTYGDSVGLLRTAIDNMVATPEVKSGLLENALQGYSRAALDTEIEDLTDNKTPNQALQGLLSIKANIGQSVPYLGLNARGREKFRNDIDKSIVKNQTAIIKFDKDQEKQRLRASKDKLTLETAITTARDKETKELASKSITWLKGNPAKTEQVDEAVKQCEGSLDAKCLLLNQTIEMSNLVVGSLGKTDYASSDTLSKFTPEGLVEFNTMRGKYYEALTKEPLDFLNINQRPFMQSLANDLTSRRISKGQYNQAVLDKQSSLGVPSDKLRILNSDDDIKIGELLKTGDTLKALQYIEVNGNTGEENGGVYYTTERLITRGVLPKGFNTLNIGGEGVTLEDNGDIVKALTEYKANKLAYKLENALDVTNVTATEKEINVVIKTSDSLTSLSNSTLQVKELNEIHTATKAYTYMLINQGIGVTEATELAIHKVVKSRFKSIAIDGNGWIFNDSANSILVEANTPQADYEIYQEGFDEVINNLGDFVVVPEMSQENASVYLNDLERKIRKGDIKFIKSGNSYELIPILDSGRFGNSTLTLIQPINLQLFKSLGL